MRILFIGTSSNSGKTLISALFCRYLRRKMISVVPFKGYNLSSSAFMTDEGEIGIGQALQAWACDIIPGPEINPVLHKASGGKLKLIVNGKEATMSRDAMLEAALASYDKLCDIYDAVVAEGSGSAAEINLTDTDIANIGLAKARNVPMILVGDIEKGGVFAGIYGTWLLIPENLRHLLKGFVINKYYGEKEILKSGIERIESLTGMRCLGVLPYMNVRLPEEDSAGEGVHTYADDEINDLVAELDRILDEAVKHLDMKGIAEYASEE